MGKVVGVLFCGVFAAAGIGFFVYSALPMISGWVSAKSWEQVQGDLISHDLKRDRSDDSITYNAKAKYQYEYAAQRYVSHKVSFSSGSDNIGSYHQDMNSKLKSISRNQRPLMVWVNPENPNEAVIDRDMRWGLLAFKSLFLFVFGGFGLGGLIFMYRSRNIGEVRPGADPLKPWTQYAEWNSATIFSNVQTANRGLLAFAIFWNLLSWPAVFLISEPISKGEYLVLFALLFPVVGCYLIWMWYQSHRSFKRTGLMPLTLNPYPGGLDGQVGGTIKLTSRLRELPKTATLSLSNIKTYKTGSGDDRKTQEQTIYEKTMVPSVVETASGMEIRFVFDLDGDLSVSEPPLDMPRKTWRIRFYAVTDDGVIIERNYDDIPVFATSGTSNIGDSQAYESKSKATLNATTLLIDSVLDLVQDERGHRLYYPAYRNKSMLGVVLFGLVFVGVGLAIPSLLFNIVFPLMGGITAMIGVYAFGNSLSVRLGAEGITSQRRLFGYQFKPQFVPSYSFKAFTKEVSSTTSSGKKTTTYYKVFANGNEGEKAIVAEGLAGVQETDAAIEKLRSL